MIKKRMTVNKISYNNPSSFNETDKVKLILLSVIVGAYPSRLFLFHNYEQVSYNK